MILVQFYCRVPGCGRKLGEIADPLPAWLAYVPRRAVAYAVRRCPRHGATPGGFERLARPGMTVSLALIPPRVPPARLWALIDKARHTQRTQQLAV